ncbi:MAG: hypothetical protein NTW55_01205 [Planctomycetota bacterium]|nr:hypothetical protein [Planctomycetota bacterium]
MRHAEDIKKLIKNTKIRTNPQVNKAVLNSLLNRLDKAESVHLDAKQPNVWRIIMKSSFTKLTAAAAIIVVVGLAVTLLDKSNTAAYALEQSIKTYHSVQTIIVRVYEGRENIDNNKFSDCWIKYDDDGRLSGFRMDVAKSADGAKSVVWSRGVAKCWMPAKNTLMIAKGEKMATDLEEFATENDPKQILQRIYDSQKNEEITLKTNEPQQNGGPIVLEVIHNLDKTLTKLFIDVQTKLPTQVEKYRFTGNEYELEIKFEFSGYNQPIDESVFELGEVPSDAVIIDSASQLCGLPQGDLPDNEIAVKVMREFFEASISQDYERVKKLLGGKPGDTLEMMYGGKILRVLSIGQPEPDEKFKHLIRVQSRVEIENKGGNWITNIKLIARRLNGQPDRWIVDW